jgi:hypothetical protein
MTNYNALGQNPETLGINRKFTVINSNQFLRLERKTFLLFNFLNL